MKTTCYLDLSSKEEGSSLLIVFLFEIITLNVNVLLTRNCAHLLALTVSLGQGWIGDCSGKMPNLLQNQTWSAGSTR